MIALVAYGYVELLSRFRDALFAMCFQETTNFVFVVKFCAMSRNACDIASTFFKTISIIFISSRHLPNRPPSTDFFPN